MNLCSFIGHKWPKSEKLPEVGPNESMAIHCLRCGHSEIVYGWLRQAFEQVEGK